LNCGDVLESKGDIIVVLCLQVLALFLEILAIVIMPSRNFNVQNVVVKVLDVLKVLSELFLEFEKVLGVGITHNASEFWHDLLGSFSSELELALTDLH